MSPLDILIPTYRRPVALSITLTSLLYQTFEDYRIVIADQTEDESPWDRKEFQALLRVFAAHGQPVELHKNDPPKGMAEQRQFLLDLARAPHALFLDDDVILERYVIDKMYRLLAETGCGFVGSAVIGLSYVDDVRPHEQEIELWTGPVQPEVVRPGTRQWDRYRLHNAANLYHVQTRLGANPDRPRAYRIAWTGGCVLYDAQKLRSVGGYEFWRDLPPEHCGEDVLVQLKLMEKYGGCGIIPSGVYHQELPTTVPDRRINAPTVLAL